MDFISTTEAAERLGVDESRVRQLLRAGELAGEKLQRGGRDWLVSRASVDAYQPPLRGWPKGKPRKKAKKSSRSQ